MENRKAKFAIIIALAILALLLISIFFLQRKESNLLSQSLQFLLNKEIGTPYKIINSSNDLSFKDSSAEWLVESTNEVTPEKLASLGLSVADAADLDYFKKNISSKSLLENSNIYILYRGEMTLGKNSLCQETPCNIYILTYDKKNRMTVGIYSK